MLNITHTEYTNFLNRAMKDNPKVKLNLNVTEPNEWNRYFCSQQGISYLKHDGFMGGLCRVKEGDEKIAKLHQDHRIKLGGYFLECYDGKLTKIYSKQGFKVVARVKFNEEFAPEGWEQDKDLKSKPDVIFMSLYDVPTIQTNDYNKAYKYASSSKNISTTER